MLEKVTGLLKKSWTSYRQGGLAKFVSDTTAFIKRELLFHPAVPPISLTLGRKTIELGARWKYLFDEALPGPTDTIIDIGVQNGRDTASFAKFGERVIGFEPSPRNYEDAVENLERFDNVELHNTGVWNEADQLELQYGTDSGDDGFLKPDSEQTETASEIPVDTLESLVDELNVETVDFLKIEAEGAEPEVISGIGNLRIKTVVVNVDEERDGDTTAEQVITTLQNKGYSLIAAKRNHIVVLVLDDVRSGIFSDIAI